MERHFRSGLEPVTRLVSRTSEYTYTPAWWVPGAHLRTLWGKLVRRPRPITTRVERWATADGDEIELHRVDPVDRSSAHGGRLLVLHGLEGTIQSHYLRGILAQARELGWAADALIFRTCNGELTRARRLYHSGETTDLDLVVQRLVREHPGQPLALAGFSLGGNVLLKWLGERGSDLPPEVRSAAAVSVPFDLERGSRFIERGFSRVYTRHFLRTLRTKALAKLARDPDLFDAASLDRARTLFAFDDAVTAPVHGFADAVDYYRRSSSIRFLYAIRCPTLLLSAYDDPFLPPAVLREVEAIAEANPCIVVEFHQRGGHVGFIAGRWPWAARYYAEERVLSFLRSATAHQQSR
jgi:predicted alpha/beta-fold hydrolase